MPILIIKEMGSVYITAHVIPATGVNVHGHGIKATVSTLDFLGYKRIVLKPDPEEAILALKDRVNREWSGEITMEESPVEESKSNGGIENGGQHVQGMVRTFRDALESRYGEQD